MKEERKAPQRDIYISFEKHRLRISGFEDGKNQKNI